MRRMIFACNCMMRSTAKARACTCNLGRQLCVEAEEKLVVLVWRRKVGDLLAFPSALAGVLRATVATVMEDVGEVVLDAGLPKSTK